MDDTLTWGSWVARRRSLLDLTRRDLAEALGCSPPLIYYFERQHGRPSESMAHALATQLQLHPQYHALFVAVARENQPANKLPVPEYAHLCTETVLPFPPPPPVSNALIGRTAELQALHHLMTTSTTRLLTIMGTGGVGKTHLTLELISRLRSHITDAMVWIDLTQVRSVKLLPLLLASVMQLPQTHPDNVWAQIIQVLQQRTCLLIFDNAEHLLPDVAQIIHHMLTAIPELTILVTSRAALNLPQEQIYSLQPFDVSQLNGVSTTDQLVQHAGVALFLERMHQRGGAPALDDHNVQAIAEICRMLDGLPLALELAAARTRVLPPSMLREQLASHLLPLLQQHGPDRPQRQHTLALTIDWSYQLVAPSAQALFARLGVFVTAMDTDTIHAVCAANITKAELQQQLDQLVAAQLVIYTSQDDAPPTYHMLETIRAFATELIIDTPVYHDLMHTYAHRIQTTVEAAINHVFIHGETPQPWTTYIQQHQAQIHHCLAYLVHHHSTAAIHVLMVISRFWELLGYAHDMIKWATTITTTMNLSTQHYIQVQNISSRALIHFNHYQQATHILEACIARITDQEEQDRDAMVKTLHSLGYCYLNMKRLQEAEQCYVTMYTIVRQQNSPILIMHALSNLAHVERALQHPDTALDLYQQALSMARQYNNQLQICATLTDIATILLQQGHVAQALPYLTEAMDYSQTVTNRSSQEYHFVLRGQAALLQGNIDPARHDLQRALTMGHESGNQANICEILELFALIAARTGHLQSAAYLYGATTTLRAQWQTPQLYSSIFIDQLHDILYNNPAPGLQTWWLTEGAALSLEAAIELALTQATA